MANLAETKNKTPQVTSKGFAKGVKSEFKKIIWPTKKDTVNYTIVVIVISIISALIIYGLDFVFTNLLKLILS